MDQARTAGLWPAVAGCVQGLSVLYERTGRDSEWASLVAEITQDFTDPATGGPLPGQESGWNIVTNHRVRLAINARDWPTAIALQDAAAAWNRDEAAEALASPAASLTPDQRTRIRNLAACVLSLGDILRDQQDPGCVAHYQEVFALVQRIGDHTAEAQSAGCLGNAYLVVPGLRDLDKAEHWFQHSLSMRADSDRLGRARNLSSLGLVALERFSHARAAGEAESVLREHLGTALNRSRQSLDLTPADDHEARGLREHQLGQIFAQTSEVGQALRHFQLAIQHHEARGDSYRAGLTRHSIALLLARDGQISDALHYARAALHNFERAGPGAAADADTSRRLIAGLERGSR
jgi:tetratricopeptide (TPR) repeat protein